MQLNEFDFNLPDNLIATNPVFPRHDARMLVPFLSPSLASEQDNSISRRDTISFGEYKVKDLPTFLQPNDILVFNNTKVIQARLYGKRLKSQNMPTGGALKLDEIDISSFANVEITLHKEETLLDNDNGISCVVWQVFAKPARKLNQGDLFIVTKDFYGEVISKSDTEVLIKFPFRRDLFFAMLDRHGFAPLPPYIKKDVKADKALDSDNYQTVYATVPGAVAAPTAGLHFTEELLQEIKDKNIEIVFVTLHVGAGTFMPVKVDDISKHKMHKEYGVITAEVAERINRAKKNGGRVIAVGTTSLRLLESAINAEGVLNPYANETGIFITPGYKFKLVDMLLTNFHLPKSTLLMLVMAFSGMKNIKSLYKYAIDNEYRFYSYGDACLLTRLS